jgi:hypothetical protein
MKTKVFVCLALLFTIVVASGGRGLAHAPRHKLAGTINDYTAALDAAGPWHVSGTWSLALEGHSGRGNFSAALTMVRADNAARAAHTHHVTIADGDVMLLPNGFRISGPAELTSNGNVAGFTGSTVEITVTGGNALEASNVAIAFGGTSMAHFGDQPLHGVVTQRP